MSQFQWDNPAFWRYVPSALENISAHCSLVDCRVFRAASQSTAAGEKMINYCNTIKKITRIHHHPTLAMLWINSAGIFVMKGESPSLQMGMWSSFHTGFEKTEEVGRAGKHAWTDSWICCQNTWLCHFPQEWLRSNWLKEQTIFWAPTVYLTWC